MAELGAHKELTPADMDDFFKLLKASEINFEWWTGVLPKKLVIGSEIIRKLSKVTGFYQRPELKAEVTSYSPIVRFFKLTHTVVTIQEDYDELFFHFEP